MGGQSRSAQKRNVMALVSHIRKTPGELEVDTQIGGVLL